MVELVDINNNDRDSNKHVIKLLILKEFPKSSNVPDNGSITISSEDYINESNNIKQEQIFNIMSPDLLSPIQQEL